jgi:hypothetical protein
MLHLRLRPVLTTVALGCLLGTSGCVSWLKPFDVPEYVSFARGTSTGPHVFFSMSPESDSFEFSTPERVAIYSLHEREVTEIEGDTGAFVAVGDEILLVKDGSLSRYKPQPGGKLEHKETLIESMPEGAIEIMPAGADRILAGYRGKVALFARAEGQTAGPLTETRTVFEGTYLDFSYDAHDDSVWMIEGDGDHVQSVSLAAVEQWEAPQPEKRLELPERWNTGPDPIVPGEHFAVVFNRITHFEDMVVVNKAEGTSASFEDHFPTLGDDGNQALFANGYADVVHLDADRFLIAFSDEEDDDRFTLGGEEGAGVIYEVDVAARTLTPRALLPEPVFSLVPDPEGLVAGGRANLYFFGPDWELIDQQKFHGATTLTRGLAHAANGTISVTASVGLGAVIGVAAIVTSPVWGTWLLIDALD